MGKWVYVERCCRCDGTGWSDEYSQDCPMCDGSGMDTATEAELEAAMDPREG